MDILEMIEQCTYSANIDGCAKRVVDRDELLRLVEGVDSAECKGRNCTSKDEKSHSKDCLTEASFEFSRTPCQTVGCGMVASRYWGGSPMCGKCDPSN